MVFLFSGLFGLLHFRGQFFLFRAYVDYNNFKGDFVVNSFDFDDTGDSTVCLAFSVLEGTFSSSEASSNYFLVSQAASSCLVVFSDNGSSSSVDSFFSLEASSTFSLVDQDGSFSSEVFWSKRLFLQPFTSF